MWVLPSMHRFRLTVLDDDGATICDKLLNDEYVYVSFGPVVTPWMK